MDSSVRPPGDDPSDAYKYRIEPIEKDRSREPFKPKEPPAQEKTHFIVVYLLGMLRKFTRFFEKKMQSEPLLAEVQTVRLHLLEFKSVLEILKLENKSQEASFLHQLSEIWIDLSHDAAELSTAVAWNRRFLSLIDRLNHFPLNLEHTLGYYLSEYAGEKWFPLPFMEMIEKLHKQHQKTPDYSELTIWTALIDELLTETL